MHVAACGIAGGEDDQIGAQAEVEHLTRFEHAVFAVAVAAREQQSRVQPVVVPEQATFSQVTPASSAYPIVTVIGSALFLSEKLTLIRGLGTALVVAGVVLLSR